MNRARKNRIESSKLYYELTFLERHRQRNITPFLVTIYNIARKIKPHFDEEGC